MTLAIVLPGLKMLFGRKFEFPMTIVTAIVSPSALPKARRTPAKMPEYVRIIEH
jgi:hypothetical protein